MFVLASEGLFGWDETDCCPITPLKMSKRVGTKGLKEGLPSN